MSTSVERLRVRESLPKLGIASNAMAFLQLTSSASPQIASMLPMLLVRLIIEITVSNIYKKRVQIV